MRILLDHCVPASIRRAVPGHVIVTTRRMRWENLRNGELLRSASESKFDVFLTVDRGFKHQHDLRALPIAVILIVAVRNSLPMLLPHIPELVLVLATIKPGSFVEIPAATP